MTVIIGAIRVRLADVLDDQGRVDICAQVAEMVAGYRATWTGLTRGRHLSGHTWRGVVELDLRRQIAPGGHCVATLAAMGVSDAPLARDERLLIVHTHLVLDGSDAVSDGDADGEAWADRVRAVLRSAWPGAWRTLTKGLRVDQTVPMAIRKLHGYSHKRRLQYAHEGTGWGDIPTAYSDQYERPWAAMVQEAYAAITTELRSRR